MEINDQLLPTLINATDFDPEQTGAGFWREAYRNAGTKPTRDRLGM
jgi:hypothetical protein